MKIKCFVERCEIFQQNKKETVAKQGLFQPLPISMQEWSDIIMDFEDRLPLTDRKNTTLMVVACLTKDAHFGTLSHQYKATTRAQIFID